MALDPTDMAAAEESSIRSLCRALTPTALEALRAALGEGGTVAVSAAKVVLEYGWGRAPAAPEDREAELAKASILRPLAAMSVTELLQLAALPPEVELAAPAVAEELPE